MSVAKILCCLLLTCHLSEGKKIKGERASVADPEQRAVLPVKEPYVSSSVFSLFSGGEDTCTLDPLQLHTLTSCGFNSSNPLIIITHGWSVDGMMESWVLRLATALKTNLVDVNVVITDWLSLAHQHYPIAVQSTRTVGKDITHLVQTLQVRYQYPPKKVHLIGYSLGAHISGFAGSYLEGSGKIGRITGDPTEVALGPMVLLNPKHIHQRKEKINGFHCILNFHHLFFLFKLLLIGFEQTVKCAHERSVHLFIDSLLNKDKQSTAYRCSDNNAFVKGVCLDCRKNRCNTLGYDIKKVRTGTSKRLYLKTGPRMPYKLYHYQFRIQFINQMESIDPTLTIALTGTKEESGDVTITFNDEISGNTTFTFLITLDKDLGDLMLLKLHWEGSALWKNVWNRVQTIIPWGGQEAKPLLTMGKISVKAGETQERTSFCAMSNDGQHLEVSEDKVFVRCKEDLPKQRRRKHNL
uniref:triacylglycerol lipase n=1 Tax=Stegastes partitus TaxID=144197 RepID=A0A3B5A9Z1_9TELE